MVVDEEEKEEVNETALLAPPEMPGTEPVPARVPSTRGKAEQKKQRVFTRSPDYRSPLSYYKSYKVTNCSLQGYFRAKYRWKYGNTQLPMCFLWKGSLDELHEYIDALVDGKRKEQLFWENAGVAYSHEFNTVAEGKQVIEISKVRLLAVLRGEDPLHVPINSTLRFTEFSNSGKRLVPAEVIAEMLSTELEDLYVQELEKRLAKGLPILYVSGQGKMLGELKDRLVQDVSVKNSAENLAAIEKHEGFAPVAPDALSEGETLPAEELVHLQDFGTHHEEVIIKRPPGNGMPYFVRRLSRDARLLWCGTSYCVNGPWKVYHTDPQRLLAIGIVP